jgi:hypothetical protein
MLEVLVCKFCAVDALATGSVVIGKVASLKHETWNDAVEARPFVSANVCWTAATSSTGCGSPESHLARAQDFEVCAEK